MVQRLNRNQDNNAVATTSVAMGYGSVATLQRCGNVVTCHMNTVVTSFPSSDGNVLGELMTSGYRPTGQQAEMVASASAGATNTRICWNINTDGTMAYGNMSSIGGGTRLIGSAMWFTGDTWP